MGVWYSNGTCDAAKNLTLTRAPSREGEGAVREADYAHTGRKAQPVSG